MVYLIDERLTKFTDCGGSFGLLEDNIEITSPNYPENYPNNAACKWEFSNPARHNKMYYVLFHDCELEDYIDIFHINANTNFNKCSYWASQNGKPNVIQINNQDLKISFNSDAKISKTGFRVSVIVRGKNDL